MHLLPDYFYDINTFSVTFRLFLAVLFGGAIGMERGATKHSAGFRTHILVCVGAALAMLTNPIHRSDLHRQHRSFEDGRTGYHRRRASLELERSW